MAAGKNPPFGNGRRFEPGARGNGQSFKENAVRLLSLMVPV